MTNNESEKECNKCVHSISKRIIGLCECGCHDSSPLPTSLEEILKEWKTTVHSDIKDALFICQTFEAGREIGFKEGQDVGLRQSAEVYDRVRKSDKIESRSATIREVLDLIPDYIECIQGGHMGAKLDWLKSKISNLGETK